MTRYDAYLFVHIAAAVIWVGAGFLLTVLAYRTERASDDARIKNLLDDSNALGTRLFIPASLTVVVFGILMIADGPWTFGYLWIVLGLLGYAATFVTGAFVLKPWGERIEAMIKRDGGLTPAAMTEIRKLLWLGRIDLVTLFLVIFDMAVKPSGDDSGILIGMAIVFVAGAAYVISRARAVEEAGEPQVATG
jgi:uncharacterized membrane protein